MNMFIVFPFLTFFIVSPEIICAERHSLFASKTRKCWVSEMTKKKCLFYQKLWIVCFSVISALNTEGKKYFFLLFFSEIHIFIVLECYKLHPSALYLKYPNLNTILKPTSLYKVTINIDSPQNILFINSG